MRNPKECVDITSWFNYFIAGELSFSTEYNSKRPKTAFSPFWPKVDRHFHTARQNAFKRVNNSPIMLCPQMMNAVSELHLPCGYCSESRVAECSKITPRESFGAPRLRYDQDHDHAEQERDKNSAMCFLTVGETGLHFNLGKRWAGLCNAFHSLGRLLCANGTARLHRCALQLVQKVDMTCAAVGPTTPTPLFHQDQSHGSSALYRHIW